MVSVGLPSDLRCAILQPICKCHVAVCQVESVIPTEFRRHGILLRKDKSHDLTQLHVIQEELNMHGVGRIFGGSVRFVVEEVVFADHFHVGIFDVDGHRTSERHGNRSVSGEQGPPYTLPQPLVCFAELRAFDTVADISVAKQNVTAIDKIRTFCACLSPERQ